MASSEFKRAEELFNGAISRPPGDRNAYLDSATGDDRELRDHVRRLLDRSEREETLTPLERTPSATTNPLEGRTIGNFRIVRRLGEGGFGDVYEAEQSVPVKRTVAMKVIKPGMDTRQVIARFEAERNALALMDHSGIARVIDAGSTDDGRPYFVMELVRNGQPITDYCNAHRLTTMQRLRLFMKVCSAVQHAHQKGIIHRDIKPSNVLVMTVDEKPLPKVIDFGIAKAIDQPNADQTVLTQDRQFVGTPNYMSPEQASPERMDIDTRSDVYSLGVLLYELLTDTTPLDMETPSRITYVEMLRRVRDDTPPNPSERLSRLSEQAAAIADRRGQSTHALDREVRGDMDWVVMKALEKDRSRRYNSASEFAADVSRFLRHEPVAAGPPTRSYRLRKFVRRNRIAVAGSGAVALVLVAGITTSTVFAVGQSRARQDAESAHNETSRQARITEAVNAFLNDDLLAMASPLEGDRQITVREVIDRAAESIDGRFPDEPLVEAAIRTTIGKTYVRLGEYNQAEPHLQRALELTHENLGFDVPDALERAKELAAVVRRQGRLEEAEKIARTALETVHLSSATRASRPYPALLSGLGVIRRRQDHWDEAETLFREALRIGREILPSDSRDLRAYLGNLSIVLHQSGRLDEAVPIAQELLELTRIQEGPDHPDTLSAMHNVAIMHAVGGDAETSIALFEEIVERRTRVLGDEHPRRLDSVQDLAGMYLDQGRLDEAERMLSELLEVRRRLHPPSHFQTLDVLNQLATIEARRLNFEAAVEIYRDVLRRRQETLGPGHTDVLDSLRALGEAYLAASEFNQADTTLRELLALARENLPEDHWWIGEFLRLHGAALSALGQTDEARTLLREAIEILNSSFGANDGRTIAAQQALDQLGN